MGVTADERKHIFPLLGNSAGIEIRMVRGPVVGDEGEKIEGPGDLRLEVVSITQTTDQTRQPITSNSLGPLVTRGVKENLFDPQIETARDRIHPNMQFAHALIRLPSDRKESHEVHHWPTGYLYKGEFHYGESIILVRFDTHWNIATTLIDGQNGTPMVLQRPWLTIIEQGGHKKLVNPMQ